MRGEGGSVAIVAAALIGLLAVLTAGLGGLAQVVAARDQAQMAADAAALAAAPVTFRQFGAKGSAHGEAGRFAEANGARLVGCAGCEIDASWQSRIVAACAFSNSSGRRITNEPVFHPQSRVWVTL